MNIISKYNLVMMLVVLMLYSLPLNLFAQSADLFSKVMRNDINAVKELIASGADINQQNEMYGHTPLIIACNYNYVDLAKYLIFQGADVNIRGKDGSTALIAAGGNSQELVEILLSKGADVKIKMENGTGVFTQCINGMLMDRVSIELAEILLSKGADVDESPTAGAIKGYTPLIMAASNNNEVLVKFLIKNDADVNAKTGDGSTAMSLALKNGHENIVNILKANGAK